MKTRNKFLAVAFFLMAFFTVTESHSQNMLQGDPDPEIEQRAAETMEMWARQLGLTGEQEILMEKKIIEFEMKRQEVLNSKMNEAAKKERLIVLQEEENADMADILTQPQLDRYLVLLNEQYQEAARDNKSSEKDKKQQTENPF